MIGGWDIGEVPFGVWDGVAGELPDSFGTEDSVAADWVTATVLVGAASIPALELLAAHPARAPIAIATEIPRTDPHTLVIIRSALRVSLPPARSS